MRINLTRTTIFTTGMYPQRIPMILHLMPIWNEVKYTQRIPAQKIMFSPRTTHSKVPNQLRSVPSAIADTSVKSKTADAMTVVTRKSFSKLHPVLQILRRVLDFMMLRTCSVLQPHFRRNKSDEALAFQFSRLDCAECRQK